VTLLLTSIGATACGGRAAKRGHMPREPARAGLRDRRSNANATGGPRSTVGSIHRRRVLVVPDDVRVSEVRWMDSEARSGVCRLVARGGDGDEDGEAGNREGLRRIWLGHAGEVQRRHGTSGQRFLFAEPTWPGFSTNELMPAKRNDPITSLRVSADPSVCQ
jgi:hypothetical protein